jgi:hypothetical protein
MLDETQRRHLSDAIALMKDEWQPDFGCDDPSCTIEEPRCSARRVEATIHELEAILHPVVTTRHPERLAGGSAERIFFEAAQGLAKREPGINHGFSTLAHLLNPNLKGFPPVPSAVEAEIVGTVIQWLGTNCGYSFVSECEQRVKRESAERRNWHVDILGPFLKDSLPWCDEHAARLVHEHLTPEDHRAAPVVTRVSHALQQLVTVLAVRVGQLPVTEAARRFGVTVDEFQRLSDRCVTVAVSVKKEPELAAV